MIIKENDNDKDNWYRFRPMTEELGDGNIRISIWFRDETGNDYRPYYYGAEPRWSESDDGCDD